MKKGGQMSYQLTTGLWVVADGPGSPGRNILPGEGRCNTVGGRTVGVGRRETTMGVTDRREDGDDRVASGDER